MSNEEIQSIITNEDLWYNYTRNHKLNNSKEYKTILAARLKYIYSYNKDLTPYYDKDYYCNTCGANDGAYDPESGFCFHCETGIQ